MGRPTGPPHQPVFRTFCEFVVNGHTYRSTGTGNNKKESKQDAAAAVLASVRRATSRPGGLEARRGLNTIHYCRWNQSSSRREVDLNEARVKKEAKTENDDLQAENRKLKKKVENLQKIAEINDEMSKLQKKLDNLCLDLQESSSDDEDDDENEE